MEKEGPRAPKFNSFNVNLVKEKEREREEEIKRDKKKKKREKEKEKEKEKEERYDIRERERRYDEREKDEKRDRRKNNRYNERERDRDRERDRERDSRYSEKEKELRYRERERELKYKEREKRSGDKFEKKIKQTNQELPIELTRDYDCSIDLYGDKDNLVYGSIYKYKIPTYKRFGKGFILGLNRNLIIDEIQSKIKGSIVFKQKSKKEMSRYIDIKIDENKNLFNIKNLKKSTEKNETILDYDYGFIKFQPDEEVLIDKQNEEYDPIKNKIKEFETKLTENNKDVSLWLEYCEYYEKTNLKKDFKNKRMILDIQLAMLERALQFNHGNEQLILKYMKYGQEIWDSTTILSKWENYLIQFQNQYELIFHYLLFRLSYSNQFNVNEIITLFQSKFNQLLNLRNDSNFIKIDPIIFKSIILLTNMLIQAGYNELVIGIYQTIIEYNLLNPDLSNYNNNIDKKQLFKIYWEKEFNRIGDLGSGGWKMYFKEKITPNYGKEEENNNLYLPIRSTNELWKKEGDPFKVILFEDIEGFIIQFKCSNTIYNLLQHFVTILICPFFNIKCTNELQSNDDSVSLNHFFNMDKVLDKLQFDNFEIQLNVDGVIDNNNNSNNNNNQKLEIPIDMIPNSFYILLDANKSMFNSRLNNLEYFKFSKRVLLKCFDIDPSNLLFIILYLKIEELFGAKEKINSIYKSQLKENSNQILMWLAYIDNLWKQGDYKKARQRFVLLLEYYYQNPTHYKGSITMIYSHWCKLEWNLNNTNHILTIIYCYIHKLVPEFNENYENYIKLITNIDIEELIQELIGREYNLFMTKEIDQISNYCYLISILKYLKGGMDEYMNYIERNLESINNIFGNNRILENLGMLYFKQIEQLQLNEKYYSIKQYRKLVGFTLKLYPNNSYFNTIYLKLEDKTKLNSINYCNDQHRAINCLNLLLNNNQNKNFYLFWIIFIKVQILNGKDIKNSIYSALSKAFYSQDLFNFILNLPLNSEDYNNFTNLAIELELRSFLLK
ncbi:DUF1740-domain-containing protein [Neoconidiobolus thromboides FSU 785]|nr:DUF1740-domain-containing protein [Neoconidiobolus thromboides FSU 785]